jgi:hypothetical protein
MRLLYHNVLQWIGVSTRDWDPFRPSDSASRGTFDHICGSTVQLPLLWDFLGILESNQGLTTCVGALLNCTLGKYTCTIFHSSG